MSLFLGANAAEGGKMRTAQARPFGKPCCLPPMVSGMLVSTVLLMGVLGAAGGATAATRVTHGGSFGLGLILGDPVAVSGRYWFDSDLAVQASIGGTWWHRGAQLTTDMVYGLRGFIPVKTPAVQLDLTLGGGAAFGAWTDVVYCSPRPSTYCEARTGFAFALRGPVTFSVLLTAVPLDFFVELAPSLLFLPHVGFKLDAGIGARYFL